MVESVAGPSARLRGDIVRLKVTIGVAYTRSLWNWSSEGTGTTGDSGSWTIFFAFVVIWIFQYVTAISDASRGQNGDVVWDWLSFFPDRTELSV